MESHLISTQKPRPALMVKAYMLLKRRLVAARTRLKLKAQEGGLTISPRSEHVPEPIEDMRRSTAEAASFPLEVIHRTPSREEMIKDGIKLLEQRLSHMQMETAQMKDDGNCQFRALSHQMYGTQDYYPEVRQAVVGHMLQHKDEFGMFLDEPIDEYLTRMSRDRVWGDELTMKAAVDAFKLRVHAVTSNQENWHLLYENDDAEPPVERDWFHGTENSRFPEARRKVFVTYIAPVHFNSILPDREKAAACTKRYNQEKGDCCEATGYGHCDAEEGSEAEAANHHHHVADQPDQPVAAAQPDTTDAEKEEIARDVRNAQRLAALTEAACPGESSKTTTKIVI